MKSNSLFRKGLAIVVLCLACMAIAFIFWRQELKYLQPTSVPHNYVAVPIGKDVALPAALAPGTSYFLHFYNPDCPCSRFNAKHIQSMRSFDIIRQNNNNTQSLYDALILTWLHAMLMNVRNI